MEIVTYPDPRLSTVCEPVTKFDDELILTIRGMFAVMASNRGIGLAAPQVGILKRFYVAIDEKLDFAGAVYINPEIKFPGTEQTEEIEGCLSIPGKRFKTNRYREIEISYQNEDGEWKMKNISGFYAVIHQHEFDHINGKLINRFPEENTEVDN